MSKHSNKIVALVGSLDTKAQDFAFMREQLCGMGVQVRLVDFGVLGDPSLLPDISNQEVAAAGGIRLKDLRDRRDKTEAMRTMSLGLSGIVRDLQKTGAIHGILGMGGTGGSSIVSAAMRDLPLGFPKVLVTTVAAGDISPYVGTRDITIIPSVVDVAGVNRISRRIYSNAAAAIAGMVNAEDTGSVAEKPIVIASMFGNTTSCVEHAKGLLEARELEVLVFHATGSGGRTMRSLVADGQVDAILDITTTELADEVCGGVFSAGSDRVRLGADCAIPILIAPGCVDMCNFGAMATVPERFRSRKLYEWNANVTLMRTNVQENIRIGELLAETANSSAGPVSVLIPLKGVSMLDSPGGAFWDPDADAACFQAIRKNLRTGIPVVEVDSNINDPQFADRAAADLLSMLNK